MSDSVIFDIEIKGLPPEWDIEEIKNVAEINPKIDKSIIDDELGVSFVPMPAVSAGSGVIDVSQARPFFEVKKGYTGFLEGDVLFAKITPCMENGKMAVVPNLINGYGFGSTEFHVLRPTHVDAKYLYFFVSSENFRRGAAHHMTGAVGQKRVPALYLKECKIPIAPPNEQQRIVAEIEKQFSRLDEAVENLKRVKANLKRYKAAVLKAAVEGKLTEEWRKNNPDVEPADKLLNRILTERRKKWEQAELAKMKAQGKTPKDDKWKKKYKEPAKPDFNRMSELPDSWCWVSLDQLLKFSQNGFSKRNGKKGVPTHVLRLLDIVGGKIFENDPRDILLTKEEIGKYELQDGDLLCIRVNGSTNLVGRMIVFKSNDTWAFCDHFIRFRVFEDMIVEQYVKSFFDTELARNYIKHNMVSSAGQNTVSQVTMGSTIIPLPPYKEQVEIMLQIEKNLSVIEESEIILDKGLKRAGRLRQSILKEAFSGQLV